MNTTKFLSPLVPSNPGKKGKRPHVKYRRIREKAEEIVRLREDVGWSNNRCALTLGFRTAGEFDEAYQLLKSNGAKLVEHGDWSGVEAAVYASFPDYQSDKQFRELLLDLKDPRVLPGGSLEHAPIGPVRTPPPPPGSTPAKAPASTLGSTPGQTPADGQGYVEAPQKRWGRKSGQGPQTGAPADAVSA